MNNFSEFQGKVWAGVSAMLARCTNITALAREVERLGLTKERNHYFCDDLDNITIHAKDRDDFDDLHFKITCTGWALVKRWGKPKPNIHDSYYHNYTNPAFGDVELHLAANCREAYQLSLDYQTPEEIAHELR